MRLLVNPLIFLLLVVELKSMMKDCVEFLQLNHGLVYTVDVDVELVLMTFFGFDLDFGKFLETKFVFRILCSLCEVITGRRINCEDSDSG